MSWIHTISLFSGNFPLGFSFSLTPPYWFPLLSILLYLSSLLLYAESRVHQDSGESKLEKENLWQGSQRLLLGDLILSSRVQYWVISWLFEDIKGNIGSIKGKINHLMWLLFNFWQLERTKPSSSLSLLSYQMYLIWFRCLGNLLLVYSITFMFCECFDSSYLWLKVGKWHCFFSVKDFWKRLASKLRAQEIINNNTVIITTHYFFKLIFQKVIVWSWILMDSSFLCRGNLKQLCS